VLFARKPAGRFCMPWTSINRPSFKNNRFGQIAQPYAGIGWWIYFWVAKVNDWRKGKVITLEGIGANDFI
jgi:hypothetical protein